MLPRWNAARSGGSIGRGRALPGWARRVSFSRSKNGYGLVVMVLAVLSVCVPIYLLVRHMRSDQHRLTGISGPLSKAELGHSTWMFLHAMAAKFPVNATIAQKQDYTDFMHILSRVYPCHECAGHFQTVLRQHPPDVRTPELFSKWMCKVHNIVHQRLKQPLYSCEVADIGKEWPLYLSDEDCGCKPEDVKSEPFALASDAQ